MEAVARALVDLMSGTQALSWADLSQLFVHFALLSFLAIGGAITTVPDMHRLVVGEWGWLNDAQFSGSVALAQAAPGPNVLFVAVIAFNAGGLPGAAAALTGTLLPPPCCHWAPRAGASSDATPWDFRPSFKAWRP